MEEQYARARARGKGNKEEQYFSVKIYIFRMFVVYFARRFEGRCRRILICTIENAGRLCDGILKYFKAPLSNTVRTPTVKDCLGN